MLTCREGGVRPCDQWRVLSTPPSYMQLVLRAHNANPGEGRCKDGIFINIIRPYQLHPGFQVATTNFIQVNGSAQAETHSASTWAMGRGAPLLGVKTRSNLTNSRFRMMLILNGM